MKRAREPRETVLGDGRDMSAEEAFAAVVAQVHEARDAHANALKRAHEEAVTTWTAVVDACTNKPWKARELHDARMRLRDLSASQSGEYEHENENEHVAESKVDMDADTASVRRGQGSHGVGVHNRKHSHFQSQSHSHFQRRSRPQPHSQPFSLRARLPCLEDDPSSLSRQRQGGAMQHMNLKQVHETFGAADATPLSMSPPLPLSARARVLPVSAHTHANAHAYEHAHEHSWGMKAGADDFAVCEDGPGWSEAAPFTIALRPNPLLINLDALRVSAHVSTLAHARPGDAGNTGDAGAPDGIDVDREQGVGVGAGAGDTQGTRKRLRVTFDDKAEAGGSQQKPSHAAPLSRLQSELLDAVLAANNLPLRFEKRIRGDVCDACPGGVAMTIGANDSLLECPNCGVARKLSQATAATAGGGNDLDFSAHTSGKQKSRVVDVLEFTQAVQHKEPKPFVLCVLMEHMWSSAQARRAERSAFNAELATDAADFEAFSLPVEFADENPHTLESHALLFAEEVAARGPFLSAEDAEARLGARLPCLKKHLMHMSYYPVYVALQGAFESMKRKAKEDATACTTDAADVDAMSLANTGSAKGHSQSHSQSHSESHSQSQGQSMRPGKKDTKHGKQGAQGLQGKLGLCRTANTAKITIDADDDADADAQDEHQSEHGHGEHGQHGQHGQQDQKNDSVERTRLQDALASTYVGELKDVNGSYELAAKIGAALGGFHGARMTSQQREQLCVLHGRIHAELERSGARMRLPHRFTHEIRQLCLLRGLFEFLPLYPLPHPIGSAPLLVLEETLKTAFHNLGWEFTDAQRELSEADVSERLGIETFAECKANDLRDAGIVVSSGKGRKRFFVANPLPKIRWSRGMPRAHHIVHFEN